MGKVHYFQRYKSYENTVTNNTLQLIARIYSYAPQKAAELINKLVDQDAPVEIGLEILQQSAGRQSVPDGVIVQRDWKIIIETKVDAPVDVRQLIRHAADFGNVSQKILLLLTKQPIGALEVEIRTALAESARDVIFSNVTFDDVIQALDGLFREFEYEMNEVTSDFVEYCWDTGLVDRSRYMLRIVPCGQSLEINRRHGIYFHPSDRGYTAHGFTGIYKDKRVQALWENDSVFDVALTNGKVDKELVSGRATDEYDDRLALIIKAARDECGFEIETGHRFFCGVPHETDFVKTSWGGIMGQRYVDVQELVGDFVDAEQLAEKLRAYTWN